MDSFSSYLHAFIKYILNTSYISGIFLEDQATDVKKSKVLMVLYFRHSLKFSFQQYLKF